MIRHYSASDVREAGIDEAGRGCLAGPVTAAAVVLPPDFDCPGLNDSKQLSRAVREALRPEIERQAVAWAVAHVSAAEVDRINVLQATYWAMHRAVGHLSVRPDLLLVDGNRFKSYEGIAHRCFVKGDSHLMSIAAASVLAKTHRDALMGALHERYPAYGWRQNAAYPTAAHRTAIARYGPTHHHRRSFRLLPV